MNLSSIAAAALAATPTSSTSKVASALNAVKSVAAQTQSTVAAPSVQTKNDADHDLQKDLATGENPYASVGSQINLKA